MLLVSLTPKTPQENVFGQRICGDIFLLRLLLRLLRLLLRLRRLLLSPVAYMA